jgi:hypothetical protein
MLHTFCVERCHFHNTNIRTEHPEPTPTVRCKVRGGVRPYCSTVARLSKRAKRTKNSFFQINYFRKKKNRFLRHVFAQIVSPRQGFIPNLGTHCRKIAMGVPYPRCSCPWLPRGRTGVCVCVRVRSRGGNIGIFVVGKGMWPARAARRARSAPGGQKSSA